MRSLVQRLLLKIYGVDKRRLDLDISETRQRILERGKQRGETIEFARTTEASLLRSVGVSLRTQKTKTSKRLDSDGSRFRENR